MPNSFTQIKHHALEFEKTNYQYLQFVNSTDNFKQLFDHSALIFKAEIAGKIGYKTVNFRPDNSDAKPKAEYGLISFKNFSNLRKKLADNGILEEKSLNQSNITYFKLPNPYPKSTIQKFVDDLANQKIKFQQIITPNNPNPMLFVRLENLEKMLYENLRQTHPFAQRTIGTKIFNLAIESLDMYLFYANLSQQQSSEQYLRKIGANLKTIRYDMKTVENLGIIHAKNLERILEEIIITERIVKKEFK